MRDQLIEGNVICFERGMIKTMGFKAAQVWRNHRDLRLLGYIKNGVYVHRSKGEGGPIAA